LSFLEKVWDSDTSASIEFLPTTPTRAMEDKQTTPTHVMEDEQTTPTHVMEDETPAIAYVIENDLIVQAVSEQNKNFPNLGIERGVKVVGVSRANVDDEWVTVNLQDGRSISCRLLVGADGVLSKVRELCGFQSLKWDYPQSAVVATLEIHPSGANSTAWQRFLPTGPVALLPLTSSLSSLVWSTSHYHAHELVDMEPDHFTDSLNSALFGTSMSPSTSSLPQAVLRWMNRITDGSPPRLLPPTVAKVIPDTRRCFPLGFLHCPHYISSRVALVGDAVHRVHPLAGLGVNLGFGDVECLKDSILNGVSRGTDVGDECVLHEYQSKRLQRNVPIMLGIDGLCRLFSTKWLPAVLGRSVGLHIVNAYQPLKSFFTGRAERLN
jgi:ubiquinone biosynthesis monooxygenase Coq6